MPILHNVAKNLRDLGLLLNTHPNAKVMIAEMANGINFHSRTAIDNAREEK